MYALCACGNSTKTVHKINGFCYVLGLVRYEINQGSGLEGLKVDTVQIFRFFGGVLHIISTVVYTVCMGSGSRT